MKWLKKRKPGSVFRQLVASYIVFSLLLLISSYICVLGTLLWLGGGSAEFLSPYELIDENGRLRDLSFLSKTGAWIERLDSQYQVIQVYGTKKDTKQSYTQEDIYEYLSMDVVPQSRNSSSEYQGFIKAVQKEGITEYFLIKINRKVLTMSYTYNAGANTGSGHLAIGALPVFFLLFLSNCFLISAYLSRKIKRPLLKITDAMEQVKNNAEDVRLDFHAQQEFEEIRDSFNLMIERLESEKREKRINEEKKNRMLLELSHDIKTPVTTIKTYANALEAGLVRQNDLNTYYQVIDRKAERVNELVNDLFLFLKLENPDYKLCPKTTDLCEYTRQVCAGLYDEITGKGLKLEVVIPGQPLYREIDPGEFARALENLLTNAAKYNKSGSHIYVHVKQIDAGTAIEIKDDGDPVEEDIRPVLFDPFVRGDASRRTSGGTGLGLAITRKIIERQNGEINYRYAGGLNIFQISLR